MGCLTGCRLVAGRHITGSLFGTITKEVLFHLFHQVLAGASIRQATAWGAISGGTVDPTPGTSDYIGFQVEMDAKAAGLDEDIFFLELEFAYLPDLCIGLPAERVNAPTAA